MKKLFFLLLLALALPALATNNYYSNGVGAVGAIVSGTNNITTSYGTGAGSKILTGLSYKGNITVQNGTSTDIYVSFSTNLCASTNADEMVVKASSTNAKDGAHIGSQVCVRSSSGTISSGTVYAEVW